MKNRFGLIVVFVTLAVAVAGCSLGGLIGDSGDSGDSSSTSEKSGETSGDKKSTSSSSSGKVLDSGIPECDELAKYVNDNTEEIEGSLVGKAVLYMYRNTILKAIEDGTEKMSDEEKEKFGEICAKSLKQLKENESN